MAIELKPEGIRVTAVSSGFTKTNLNGFSSLEPSGTAREVVRVAMLGPDTPTGIFTRWEGEIIIGKPQAGSLAVAGTMVGLEASVQQKTFGRSQLRGCSRCPRPFVAPDTLRRRDQSPFAKRAPTHLRRGAYPATIGGENDHRVAQQ